ncbi:YmaF family protein [Pseudalkalibacillus hwajinpoensis]|uniref:YmaF family protein n=1 Tax=Guptibacillus hwajinpoensis TaxID=208199 RepID=UPI00325AC6F9
MEKRKNHTHGYLIGFSFPVNGTDHDQHVHRVEGITIREERHQHRYSVQTGPPIPLPGGGHYHLFGGETFSKEEHEHYFSGRTGKPLGSYPDDW